MRALSFEHVEAVELLDRQVQQFTEAASAYDELALLGASSCHGWSVLDLVVHVRLGLEEMLVGAGVRTTGAPDVDAASYWSTHPDDRDEDQVPHILWLRRVASGYARPRTAVLHLQNVSDAVRTTLVTLPACSVVFQDKTMTSGDFLATWVVELAVHQLDLGTGLGADNPGLGWARRTLEALADQDLPADWDDRSDVLAALGRAPGPDGTVLGAPFPLSL